MKAIVRPLYPSDGFIAFCRMQLRKGLMIRYWVTLPAMYRRELQFRREFEFTLQKYQEGGGKIIPLNDGPNAQISGPSAESDC